MQVYRKPFNDTMLPSGTFFHIPSGSAAETVRDKGAVPSVSDGKLTQLLMAFSTFYREIQHSGTTHQYIPHPAITPMILYTLRATPGYSIGTPGYNAEPISTLVSCIQVPRA